MIEFMRALLSPVRASFFAALLAVASVVGTASAQRQGKNYVRLVSKPGERNIDEGLYDPNDGWLRRGSREDRTLCLTFDDGPAPDAAARLLDILKAEKVKAGFYVVGERVQKYPQLVRRMIAEGHEVGNHTQHHIRLDGLSQAQMRDEMRDCEMAVRRATGRAMRFMRPPGMRHNAQVLAEARAQGYVVVGCNIGAKDYVPNGGIAELTSEEAASLGLDAKTIAERVEKQFKPGTIIVLHESPVTVDAVPMIIAKAREQGYRFVTTSELMASLPDPVKIVSNPSAESVAKVEAKSRVYGPQRPTNVSVGIRQ